MDRSIPAVSLTDARREKPLGKRRQAYHQEWAEVMRDTGCKHISDSCLACPLPKCLYDYPPQQQYRIKEQYNRNRNVERPRC
jgi:hypothetical protein